MLNGSNFSAYGEGLTSLKIHFNCYPGRFIACNMPDRICKKGPEINGISGVITKKTLLCREISLLVMVLAYSIIGLCKFCCHRIRIHLVCLMTWSLFAVITLDYS